MSIEETFGQEIERQLIAAERFLQHSEEDSVKKKRDEVDFLAVVGYLRWFIERDCKKHKGRLLLIFREGDRLQRMKVSAFLLQAVIAVIEFSIVSCSILVLSQLCFLHVFMLLYFYTFLYLPLSLSPLVRRLLVVFAHRQHLRFPPHHVPTSKRPR